MEEVDWDSMNHSYNALVATQQKYPNVAKLSDEQKAWLVIKIQTIAQGLKTKKELVELKKMGERLLHATEDIPNKELQKMLTFIFTNIETIKKNIS